MAITSASYADVHNLTIFVTYDDGRPDATIRNVVKRGDPSSRELQEVYAWVDAGNTITPFVDTQGRLAEAQAIATRKLIFALTSAYFAHQISDGTNTFLMSVDLTTIVNASLNSTTPGQINLMDITSTLERVNAVPQQTLLDNLKVAFLADQIGYITDLAAVNAAIDVAGVDVALMASYFGDLSPVYP